MSRLTIRLPRRDDAARTARRWVQDAVGSSLSHRRLSDLQLVVSELVNNAVVHGDGEITLVLDSQGDVIRVEVVDEGEGAVIEICREKERGPGGQGLRLVDRLSRAWGAYEGTTHVWAEFARDCGAA